MTTLVEKSNNDEPDDGGRILAITMHSLDGVKQHTVQIDNRGSGTHMIRQIRLARLRSVNDNGRHGFCDESNHCIDCCY